MAFGERRAILGGDLARMEGLIRQAQEISRDLVEKAEAAADQTETFADDTDLARILAAAKRARQDLGALARVVREARDGGGGR